MNKEEIKEILEYISSRTVDDILLPDYFERIEDYITNLQQELKEANDSITWWTNRFNALQQENESLKEDRQQLLNLISQNIDEEDNLIDYKSRIDKAIEYIEWQRDNPQYDNVWRKHECESLINILKGDSDE